MKILLFILIISAAGCTTNEEESTEEIITLSQGQHLSYPLDLDQLETRPYGTYLFVPEGSEHSQESLPLMVFLHGSGESGNSSSDPNVLDRVLKNGPPKLIDQSRWNPSTPMYVLSPQLWNPDSFSQYQWWEEEKIDRMIQWVAENHSIDEKRIYITGLSLGGYGTWAYAGYSDRQYTPAAIVPVCGGSRTQNIDDLAANISLIPVWAFHGREDSVVSPSESVYMVRHINNLDPEFEAQLTIFNGVSHASWIPVYEIDGPMSGIGQGTMEWPADRTVESWLRIYDQNIYDWMLSHSAPE